MLTKLINLLCPGSVMSPVKAVQGFLSGKKTYLAASILLLQGLLSAVEQFAGLSGTGDILMWLKNMPQNSVVFQIAQALAIFGLRAGINKTGN